MEIKNIGLVILIVILIGWGGLMDHYPQHSLNAADENLTTDSSEMNFTQVLGTTDYGTVIKVGPYGNSSSDKKIAFVVGVHPLEVNSHTAMIQSILSKSQWLNYAYYIYNIKVTKDRDSYDKGRMNGQLLARDFAVPDIINGHYNLVVDVHSNRGDNFQKQYFLYVPQEDAASMSLTSNLMVQIPDIVYYIPPNEPGPKSPSYVTIPIINSGAPAIIYETYRYEPYEVTLKHASDFIDAVDKLKSL